jgi:pimeloyl-ACP methyl ester carboxylesterase
MPVLGCDARGTGRALVLIHGFPFDRTMWALVMDELSADRRVIAVDLRGRGKSLEVGGGAEPWTLDDHADDVAATIDALGGAGRCRRALHGRRARWRCCAGIRSKVRSAI